MFHPLQPHGLYSPWNSPGQNTGVGGVFLLQGIFPVQGSNPGLPHCRWILYQLSYQRSPVQETWFDSWVRKIPGEGNGNSLQYSCLENPMDRVAWRAIIRVERLPDRQALGKVLGYCPRLESILPHLTEIKTKPWNNQTISKLFNYRQDRTKKH